MRHRRATGALIAALAARDGEEGAPFDLAGMFEFSGKHAGKLLLNPVTGQKR